jgi:hypothetical protein
LNEHQRFEQDWWGTCVNTFFEESKQITYAWNMGLEMIPDPKTGIWPQYPLGGRRILDIGGGPVSLLLKCVNFGPSLVIDPCPYPEWVDHRYDHVGIDIIHEPAEGFRVPERFDEVWIYNVLQHVEDPIECLETARAHAPLLRIFEWIDFQPSLGHPHVITKAMLDDFLGVNGSAEFFDGSSNNTYGNAYFGSYAL